MTGFTSLELMQRASCGNNRTFVKGQVVCTSPLLPGISVDVFSAAFVSFPFSCLAFIWNLKKSTKATRLR